MLRIKSPYETGLSNPISKTFIKLAIPIEKTLISILRPFNSFGTKVISFTNGSCIAKCTIAMEDSLPRDDSNAMASSILQTIITATGDGRLGELPVDASYTRMMKGNLFSLFLSAIRIERSIHDDLWVPSTIKHQ